MKPIRLIITGSDYAGKRSVAVELSKWLIANSHEREVRWHSHFVSARANTHLVVSVDDRGVFGAAEMMDGAEFDDGDVSQVKTMRPNVLEQFRRHMIWRHFAPDMYRDPHHLLIDWYYAEAVYAPLYYGYGEDGTFSDRRRRAREWDAEALRLDRQTALLLVEASPEQIRARMTRDPDPHCPLRQQDVELVLGRFAQEYENSLIPNRLRLDTSHATPADTGRQLVEWLRQIPAPASEN
ncbi:MAG TPA: hypothetical protein VHA70_13410 [Bauldia sp.]|nr:hypothetical protein [Bauldia sp.]